MDTLSIVSYELLAFALALAIVFSVKVCVITGVGMQACENPRHYRAMQLTFNDDMSSGVLAAAAGDLRGCKRPVG